MVNFLAKIIPAARNNDIESWMNILFVVVLAVFYVVGNIIKAKASKREQPKEQPPEVSPAAGQGPRPFQKTPYRGAQPLVRGTAEGQSGPQAAKPQIARPEVQPQRRKITRPQPVAKKFVAEKPDIGLLSFELPEPAKLTEFTSGAVKKLAAKHIGISEETPQGKYLSEILSDYADAGRLRSAILHYEILGKPLSLREPSEHIIGL